MWAEVSFILSQFTHLTDEWTHGRMKGRYLMAIPCLHNCITVKHWVMLGSGAGRNGGIIWPDTSFVFKCLKQLPTVRTVI